MNLATDVLRITMTKYTDNFNYCKLPVFLCIPNTEEHRLLFWGVNIVWMKLVCVCSCSRYTSIIMDAASTQ